MTLAMQARTIRLLRACSLAIPLFSAACSHPPGDDGEKIVQATLRLLTSDGKPICVDDQTTGQTLAIFAAMRLAPPPSRRPLAWSTPAPLRPPLELSNAQLLHDSFGSETVHLRDPDNVTTNLPWMVQHRLDATASALMRTATGESVTISSNWVNGVRARWWPINRLSLHCSPTYTLSKPIWSGSTGYITVTTEHWGTTYALARGPTGWSAVGQWTNWLY